MKKTIILTSGLAALLVVWILYRETQSFFKSGVVSEKNLAWINYTSPTGLFNVSLPATPEYKSEIERDADGFANRTNETYVSQDSAKSLYTVYFIRYLANEGQPPLPANTLLNNLMYQMLESQKGSHLLGFRKTTFKGRPALEFSIGNNDLINDNLALVNKGDLYLLSETGHENVIRHKDFEKFTQSFELKE
jgi:hypothetical protein